MNNWFTVRVKYTKQLDNGTFKRVSEPYLLAAMTFTDAEARIYEELGSVIKGEFNVMAIARTEFHDIFSYDDATIWHKATISFASIGEDGEKEKKVKQTFLVAAHSVKDAYDRIKENLATLMVEYKIEGVVMSPIVEVYPYSENLDREIGRRPMEPVKADADQDSEEEDAVDEGLNPQQGN